MRRTPGAGGGRGAAAPRVRGAAGPAGRRLHPAHPALRRGGGARRLPRRAHPRHPLAAGEPQRVGLSPGRPGLRGLRGRPPGGGGARRWGSRSRPGAPPSSRSPPRCASWSWRRRWEAVLGRDTATVRVEGTVGLDTPVGRLGCPWPPSRPSSCRSCPRWSSAARAWASSPRAGATVEFPLTVTNRTSYPLLLQGLSGGCPWAGPSWAASPPAPWAAWRRGRRSLTPAPHRPLPLRRRSGVARSSRGPVHPALRGPAQHPAGPIPLQLEQVVDVVH